MTTRKTVVVGGLAGALLLALAPLGAASAAVQATMPDKAVQATMLDKEVQIVGTVRRAPGDLFSLMIRTPKHSTVTVYFSSLTPLLNRTGLTIFGHAIKTGHRLVIKGTYRGSHQFFASQIEDTSIR